MPRTVIGSHSVERQHTQMVCVTRFSSRHSHRSTAWQTIRYLFRSFGGFDVHAPDDFALARGAAQFKNGRSRARPARDNENRWLTGPSSGLLSGHHHSSRHNDTSLRVHHRQQNRDALSAAEVSAKNCLEFLERPCKTFTGAPGDNLGFQSSTSPSAHLEHNSSITSVGTTAACSPNCTTLRTPGVYRICLAVLSKLRVRKEICWKERGRPLKNALLLPQRHIHHRKKHAIY